MANLSLTFDTVTIPSGVTVTTYVYEDTGSTINVASTTLTDGQTSYTLSGFNASSGNTVWPRVEPETSNDENTGVLVESANITLAVANESGSITVTSTVSATETAPANETGAIASTSTVAAKETAPARETSTTSVTSFVSATETAPARESGTVAATTTIDGAEYVTMTRTPVLQGDGRNTAMQTLRPVFPDERALDVQWDFNSEFMGFASEWLAEDSIIKHEIRDGLGVVIGGDLSTTIEVFLQYDKTGDGEADVTSAVKDLSEAYHTLTFDNNEMFGEDGYYRVIVRGLRTYDTVNQLDIGAVHSNL